jgi:ribonuclease R
VLGEEAQAQQSMVGSRADPHRPLEGLAVDVEITDFPTAGRPAKGRVIEVLGPPDAFGVDVEIIIRKHHLPHVFPANVLAEATASAAQTVDTLEPEELGRRGIFAGCRL